VVVVNATCACSITAKKEGVTYSCLYGGCAAVNRGADFVQERLNNRGILIANKQVETIFKQYGIPLEKKTISNLAKLFLGYMRELHNSRSD